MRVHHVVDAANVGLQGFVIDATQARHATIRAGRLESLSGPVDPMTHLNLDFPDHILGECVVVEDLRPGAPVRRDRAATGPESMARLGPVDIDARRVAWLEVHRQARQKHADAGR